MTSPDLAVPWPTPKPDAGELARAAVDRGAVQHAGELAELVHLLQRRRLKNVLEIGVMHGGTLWLWRRLAVPLESFAVGVDITAPVCDDCEYRRAHVDCPRRLLERNLYHFGKQEARCELVIADSTRAETVELVRKRFPLGVDFLHIDGDHGPAVWRDFEAYSELVNADGVIALHDVTLAPANEWPPAALWETLREAPGAFTISQPGGFGFGVLVGQEWRSHLYEG